jgi:hypothetical protein
MRLKRIFNHHHFLILKIRKENDDDDFNNYEFNGILGPISAIDLINVITHRPK